MTFSKFVKACKRQGVKDDDVIIFVDSSVTERRPVSMYRDDKASNIFYVDLLDKEEWNA